MIIPYHLFSLSLYRPRGLFAVPFLGAPPGLDDIIAFAPPPVLESPRGFLFVPARGPDAPVTSLIELPYSRTASPQVRVVFVILEWDQCREQYVWTNIHNYLAPAPFPAPATPFPAAATTAPAKLPTPAAAAPVVRAIQPCCCFGGMVVNGLNHGLMCNGVDDSEQLLL